MKTYPVNLVYYPLYIIQKTLKSNYVNHSNANNNILQMILQSGSKSSICLTMSQQLKLL